MKKTVLIFGGGGQDGYFLKKLLVSQNYKVIIFSHSNSIAGPCLDVGNFKDVENIIREHSPEIIFHLAAKSSTKHEFILENQNAIVQGALTILESVYRYFPTTKVFIASSALIFKNDNKPINEQNEFETKNAYTLTRIEALQIARYYRNHGIKVYIGFLFNHESPLRHPNSIVREIAKGVVNIYLGSAETLNIKNADIVKEWMWAGDAAEAIYKLITQNKVFEACIGDGIGISVKEYVIKCLKILKISNKEKLIKNLNYKNEYSNFICDPKKIKSLGWTPNFNVDYLAKQMIHAEICSRKLNLNHLIDDKS
jgi:GDPmannose 4,6-dehydratase